MLCMAPAKFTSPQWLLRKMLCGGGCSNVHRLEGANERAVTSVSGAGIEEDGKHSSVRSSYMDEADEEEAIPSGQVSCHLP